MSTPDADVMPLCDLDKKWYLVWAWLFALQFALTREAQRLKTHFDQGNPQSWFSDPSPDTTWLLPILAVAPACWLIRSSSARPWSVKSTMGFARKRGLTLWRASKLLRSWTPGEGQPPFLVKASTMPTMFRVLLVLLGCCTSAVVSSSRVADTGRSFGDVTPVIHDEFSYLLQARAFSSGRWSFEGPPEAAELFHQMHIMNEGRVASRYLPGTAAWITPFYIAGVPDLANRVAFILVCLAAAQVGWKLNGPWCGLVAGTLVALSPGMAVFSNLILSHMPCLLGLSVFLLAFSDVMQEKKATSAVVAGIGLSFAMLCRPLTAAAVGLPFGIWAVIQAVRPVFPKDGPARQPRVGVMLALGAPLLAGFTVMAIQNYAICGKLFTTPYTEYTRLYSPRHVFGFNNGVRGDAHPSPKVLPQYNDWAVNLAGPLAWKNFQTRFEQCAAWTLGRTPLLLGGIVFLFTFLRHRPFVRLLFLSGICVHLAHIPYWLTGILDYHYVFESGFLWLLLLAYVVTALVRSALSEGRLLVPVWWAIVLLVPSIFSYSDALAGHAGCRISRGVADIAHSARRYQTFCEVLQESALRKPAIVLVQQTIADLHVEYVRNAPEFDAAVLVGAWRPDLYTAEQIRTLYPERSLYTYSAHTENLRQVD